MNLLPQNISVPPVTQNGKNENHNHQSNSDPKMKNQTMCNENTTQIYTKKKYIKVQQDNKKVFLNVTFTHAFQVRWEGGDSVHWPGF